MQEQQLAPDISILIEESELSQAVATARLTQATIDAQKELYQETKLPILKAAHRVALKLMKHWEHLAGLEGVTTYKNIGVERLNKSYTHYSLRLTEEDPTVSVYTWDTYHDEHDESVMTFPLSFVHRADWLAELEIRSESAVLKRKRLAQEKEANKEQRELALLHTLMDKHKDKI